MKVQSTETDGKRVFVSLGAGWQNESGNINIIVDPDKNRKNNKASGLGYKLYAVPVDESGEVDFEAALEFTKLTVKQNPPGSSERAPSHSIFTWE